MSSKRIVVTGLGAITPIGIGAETYWNALLAGTPGMGRITLFDPEAFDVKIAAEVKGFEAGDYMDRKDARKMDRFAQFGVAAAKMAIEDSGLVIDDSNAERVGVIVGSGIGGLQSLEDQMRILIEKGPNRVSPMLIPMMIADMASGWTSILTGAKGPNTTVVTACATGANAIGDSLELLRRGAADVMIAGGTEAAITATSRRRRRARSTPPGTVS
jgi:3-oxoacyl-[acyl-carrier-protein] synthase II